MKYFMIESTFHEPLPVDPARLQELITEHRRYLRGKASRRVGPGVRPESFLGRRGSS